eukprot:1208751-Pleurochrysis_carterae.AAC.3
MVSEVSSSLRDTLLPVAHPVAGLMSDAAVPITYIILYVCIYYMYACAAPHLAGSEAITPSQITRASKAR